MAEESALRDWLRKEWEYGQPVWVEAARGGTVGAPDVLLPLGGERGYCPVELKWWHAETDYIKMTSRPAQKRFHLLAARAGNRSAYFALLSDGEKVLLPGMVLADEDQTTWLLALKRLRYVNSVEDLKTSLCDETFWRN